MAPLRALCVDQARAGTGLTRSLSLDGRDYDIACGQIDIGNAATSRNEDTARGRLETTGRVEAEPRIDVGHVARAVVYKATLPLDANVQFMTLMVTKMPISAAADREAQAPGIRPRTFADRLHSRLSPSEVR